MNVRKFNLLFGRNIRFAREELGISREELAYRADIDHSTIERIELGKSNPKNSTIFVLEDVLDINISEIYSQIRAELKQSDLE